MRNTFNDDHGDYLMHFNFKYIDKYKSAAGNWVYKYANDAKAAVNRAGVTARGKVRTATANVKLARNKASNYITGLAKEAKRVSNVAGVMARGKVRTATAYAKRAANDAYDKAYDAYDTISGHKAQRHEAKVTQNKQRAQARADRFERNDYRNSESAAKQQRANKNKANARARQDRFERENYRRNANGYEFRNEGKALAGYMGRGLSKSVRNGVNAVTDKVRNANVKPLTTRAGSLADRAVNGTYDAAVKRYNQQRNADNLLRRANTPSVPDTNDILYGKKKKK